MSSAGDGTVRLWRREANQLETKLETMAAEVPRVFLAADDRRVWSVNDLRSSEQLWTQSANERPAPLDDPFSSQRYLAAWCAARNANAMAVVWSDSPTSHTRGEAPEVFLYDKDSVRQPRSIKLTSPVHGVALAPDASLLAVSYFNSRLELYELPSARLRWARAGQRSALNNVQFTSHGDEVFARTDDGRVDAYSVADGSYRTVLEIGTERQRVHALAVSPDGRLLATSGVDGVIRVWDYRLQNGELARLECSDGEVSALAFSPDGRTLAAGTFSSTVLLWHVATWQQLARFKTRLGAVLDLCFSPEGDTLGIAGRTPTGGGQVFFWETKGPKD